MAENKSKLIKVKKGDEIIEINPLMLKQHQELGWQPVEETEEPKEEKKAKSSKAEDK